MKAAITAGLSMLLLASAAPKALAETAIIQTTTTTVQAAPAVCAPRQLSYSAVMPMPSVTLDYLPPNIDYSADFTWESTGGPFSDLLIFGDGGGG